MHRVGVRDDRWIEVGIHALHRVDVANRVFHGRNRHPGIRPAANLVQDERPHSMGASRLALHRQDAEQQVLIHRKDRVVSLRKWVLPLALKIRLLPRTGLGR